MTEIERLYWERKAANEKQLGVLLDKAMTSLTFISERICNAQHAQQAYYEQLKRNLP